MADPITVWCETSLPPEAVRAALLDFTARRPALWPGLTASLYEVYSVGDTEAEVREGTAMPGMVVWAREHYDWSKPPAIRWSVIESNFSAVGSYVEARIEPRAGGGSRIRLDWNRTGSNWRGRLMTGLIRLLRARPVKASFDMGLRKLETEAAAQTRPS
jgi:hypothetical protein